jgi:MoaA/NifB/PqqE/SkfB family radical SAM enzyme
MNVASTVIFPTRIKTSTWIRRCFSALLNYTGNGGALPCVQEVCAAFLCVNAHGEALPSPEWHYVLGNLNTHTLCDVWEHSPELPKVRAFGDLRNFLRCASYPDIQFCGMSLEGNANETGDPLVIPPEICLLARKTRELVHAHHRQSDKTRGARP